MKFIRTLILIVLGAVTFGATMTFAGLIPAQAHLWVRAGLLAVLGALWFVSRRGGALGTFRPVFFAYFAIVAGLTVAWYGEKPITTWLALGFTPMSNAVAKAVQAGLVAVTVIVLTLASGQGLGSLQLRKGRLVFGLGIGLLGFAAMAVVTFLPGGPFFAAGSLKLAPLMAVAPWVMLFVLSNAFMEELLFRGVLIERQQTLVGPGLALISTTLVFALAHVQVNYTAQVAFFVAFVFVLGLMWGLLMQKSKSIWGSVLFHAGADVAVILPMYQAMLAGH
jgi:uncharacterized protein